MPNKEIIDDYEADKIYPDWDYLAAPDKMERRNCAIYMLDIPCEQKIILYTISNQMGNSEAVSVTGTKKQFAKRVGLSVHRFNKHFSELVKAGIVGASPMEDGGTEFYIVDIPSVCA